MEVENKLYAETHGDGQGQLLPVDPPQYTPTPQQQQPGQFQGFTPTTAAASPYYALPSGAGYGGGYGVPPASQQHGDGQGQLLPADPPQYTPTPQQQQPGQFQGFTPTTAAASPYYDAPSGAGYGGGYGVPPASKQQQQVPVFTYNQAPTVNVQPVESYTGALCYSCFVFWFCCRIFGLIAYILASEYSAVNSSRTPLVSFLAFL